jgi:probable O-glycosylation ligase (exosortase A-associated)
VRDVVLLAAVVGLAPISFARPWIGVLVWSWIAYMAPHTLTWGFGRTLPVAAVIGGATLAGLLFTRDRKPMPVTLVVVLLSLFVVHFSVSTALALNPTLAWGKWNWVSKSLLMAFVTIVLFQDRAKLRLLYMVMALSMGFYGVKGGVWALRTGAGERVFGPEGTFFGDNNYLGLALAMMLPVLLCLAREEPRRWLRNVFRATFALSIAAILFTYSRGALLGLAAILIPVTWRSPWRLRFAATALLVTLVALPLIPAKWWERMQTITTDTQQMDTSELGRLEAWNTALNIARDRPVFGGGFRVLWNNDAWLQYHDGPYLVARDAHSLYFEVLGEQGVVGLAIYLGIVISTLVTLQRIRKKWRHHPAHGYLATYAEMTQLVLCPFLVAGAFLSVAYFDLYFHLVATSVVLQCLSVAAEATTDAVPGRAQLVAPVAPSRRHTRIASNKGSQHA